MRTSSWFGGGARRAPSAALACAVASLGVLVACGELSSGSGPQASREGQVVSAEGTAELSVKTNATAPRVVRAEAPWKATGTVHRGIAQVDPSTRGLLMRDPRGADAPERDPAELQRQALSELSALMLPALQVNADSRAAAFGRTSVVEMALPSSGGDSLHLVAISDLTKGPLTDYMVVRGNRPLTYQKIDWVRDGSLWRVAKVRSYALGEDGSQLRVTLKVSGELASAADVSADTGVGMLARLEEVQFASLARKLILPAAAQAQDRFPNLDCEQYRRNGIASSEPSCLAFTFNRSESIIRSVHGFIVQAFPGFTMGALLTTLSNGGVEALVALLEAAGASLGRLAALPYITEILVLGGLAAIAYVGYTFASCQSFRSQEVEECRLRDSRPPTLGGGGRNPEDDTGVTQDACSMMCDPSRRGQIDEMRGGLRYQE